MRRHLLPLILLFSILFAGVYFLLNTTWLLSSLIPSLVKTFLKTVELQSFAFERQSFAFPDTISLHQVKATFIRNDITYDMKAADISIFDVKKLTEIPHVLKFSIVGLDVQESRWQLRQADAKVFVAFSKKDFSSLEGSFRFPSIVWLPYTIENVTGRVKGNVNRWELSEITGNAYGGIFHAQLAWEYQPEAVYTLYSEINDLQVKELGKTNLTLMAGCDGELNGTLRLVADEQKVPILDVSLSMPKGGIVNTVIAGHLLNRLSDVEKQEALDRILQTEKQLPFDKASVSIKNMTDQTAILTFSIKNEKEEIHLQGSIKGLDIKKTVATYFFPVKEE